MGKISDGVKLLICFSFKTFLLYKYKLVAWNRHSSEFVGCLFILRCAKYFLTMEFAQVGKL